MSEVVLTLPDDLAKEAKEMGLFAPTRAALLFRSEMRRRRVNKFFDSADKLAAIYGEPMSEEEINAEIEASRTHRRKKS